MRYVKLSAAVLLGLVGIGGTVVGLLDVGWYMVSCIGATDQIHAHLCPGGLREGLVFVSIGLASGYGAVVAWRSRMGNHETVAS